MNIFPFVSIIIVNYNGRQLLENCLSSLRGIDYDAYEIIIVDNNSNDDSVQFIKTNYPKIKIVNLDQNYGFAHPCNIGAKQAKGEYFLFLNNDTEVTPSFLIELIKTMEKTPDLGICQSTLLKIDGTVDSGGDFLNSKGLFFSSKKHSTENQEIFGAKGACMLVKRNLFEKLNGFDSKFNFSFEDVDFSWRAWILGFRIFSVSKSIVYHLGGSTIESSNIDIDFHGTKNQLSMRITNFEFTTSIKYLFKFIINYGKNYFLFNNKTKSPSSQSNLSVNRRPRFRSIIHGFFWILFNIPYLYQKHKIVNNSRKLSTKYFEEKNLINVD